MPYTAPSPSTLPAQSSKQPRASHSSSGSSESPTCPTGRPNLPRSYSSTSYVRRHRRSPSTNKTVVLPAVESSSLLGHVVDPHASLRQSPPPLNNAAIPPGAVISPPESSQNSSDDESQNVRRERGFNLEELDAAMRSIVGVVSSQEKKRHGQSDATTNGTTVNKSVVPLSQEARKIAHSRSSTESAIVIKHEEAMTSSPDDSEREDERKPPMVRKKSGELVRPALRPPSARRRPSSMPGTPIFAKAVHFDSQLEHIRHFMQLDRPLAVSAETSPVEDYDSETEFPFGSDDLQGFEWELRLANFPKDGSDRSQQPVRLERLFLSPDKKTLLGVVSVANIAYHKHVVARFTFDYWKTVSEVAAEFDHDVRRKHANDGYDRFSFSIKLADQANLEKKTMLACIRYQVNGQEFWDNNNYMNYQVDFIKMPNLNKGDKSKASASNSRPSLPRSRRSSGTSGPRTRSMPPSFDDFSGLDEYLSFGRPQRVGQGEPQVSDNDADLDVPKPREKQSRQAFGNRYDFGASLSAAIRSKTSQDRTILTAKAKSSPESSPDKDKTLPAKHTNLFMESSPVREITRQVAHSESSRPGPLPSGQPHLDSSVYKELVDKYCFYGSTRESRSPNNEDSESDRNLSASVSPSPPSSPSLTQRADSPLHIRSGGPLPTSPISFGSRASPSPVSFGYPYHSPSRNSFLTESQTPAVIRG